MAKAFDPAAFEAGAFEAADASATQPAFVRAATGTTDGGTAITVNLAAAAAGDKLVVCTGAWQSGAAAPTGVSSNPAATWRQDAASGAAASAPSGFNQATVWSADVETAGAVTVTVAFSGAVWASATVLEFSGVAAGAASLDRAAAAAAPTPVSDFSAAVGPTAATALASEVVVAALVADDDAGTTNFGIAAASPGYTNAFLSNNGSVRPAFSADWKATSATGPQSCSWGTLASATDSWAAVLATYKATTAATARRVMVVS